MPDQPLLLVRDADYDRLGAPVAELLGRTCPPVAGKRVLVKPNLLADTPPEKAVTTHPALVRAVVEWLEARGAAEVWVGDNPGMGGEGAVERVGRRTGVAQAAGARWRNLGQGVRLVDLPGFPGLQVPIAQAVYEAEVLISLPKLKTHMFTRISGALKNSFGFIPGPEKTAMHKRFPTQEAFCRMLVAVFGLRVPDVVLMDGVLALEGNGPGAGGRPRRVGKLLASRHAAALDAGAAHLMGFLEGSLPILQAADEAGLGPVRLDRIQVDGALHAVRNYRPPAGVVTASAGLANRLAGLYLRTFRLKVKPRACTGCKRCQEACPVGAIDLVPAPPGDRGQGKPAPLRVAAIDAQRCIKCYCCMELCPEAAITPRRGVFL